MNSLLHKLMLVRMLYHSNRMQLEHLSTEVLSITSQRPASSPSLSGMLGFEDEPLGAKPFKYQSILLEWEPKLPDCILLGKKY